MLREGTVRIIPPHLTVFGCPEPRAAAALGRAMGDYERVGAGARVTLGPSKKNDQENMLRTAVGGDDGEPVNPATASMIHTSCYTTS
jgi:hypothetical protein